MPLSSAGKAILAKFQSEYGDKGKGYFYAKENKGGKFAQIVKHHASKKKKVRGN